jgi:hypothetical protein
MITIVYKRRWGQINMKKIIVIGAILAILIAGVSFVAAGSGPAPGSGDGVSDGSWLDPPYGPGSGLGPAPSAGDGESEGPE